MDPIASAVQHERPTLVSVTILLLLIVGCSGHDNVTQPPVAQDGVRILSPNDRDSLRCEWNWVVGPDSCDWRFTPTDEHYYATVSANVPGGTHTAVAYLYNSYLHQFEQYGNTIFPSTDTFQIEYWSAYNTGPYNDIDSIRFYVGVVSGNAEEWMSPSAMLVLTNNPTVDENQAPAAPLIDSCWVTTSDVYLSWCDRSFNELGFRVYCRDITQTTTDSADYPPNTHTGHIGGLMPNTTYFLLVAAWNDLGPSTQIDTHSVSTEPLPLPNPPENVVAIALAYNSVDVSWVAVGSADSFLVHRRQQDQDWQRVGCVQYNSTSFLDMTVSPSTEYFYRVGSTNSSGVSWSVDSAFVATPPFGTPLPPDQLQAEANLGVGVILSWRDRSTNETHFEISRSDEGHPEDIVGSALADVTTYTDSISEEGHYSYRVRSVNDYGASAWSAAAEAVYRFCSDGVVPLCLDNFWEYLVDSSGGQSSMRRYIADFAFIGSDDYYLIAQRPLFGGQPDSLYYLRNFSGAGCFMVDHPLPATPQPDLMFRYPTGPSGDYYRALGDCVVVLNASPGISIPIGDTTFTGVISYQRFRGGGRSTQYWIRPSDVGIVRETDYYPGSPSVTVQRDLSRYRVTN